MPISEADYDQDDVSKDSMEHAEEGYDNPFYPDQLERQRLYWATCYLYDADKLGACA